MRGAKKWQKSRLEWATKSYFVRREGQGEESRIDIEIACPDVFLIHIENKVWSEEGEDQLGREWRDLEQRASQLNVRPDARVAIFLTPTGSTPSHARFRPLAWSEVARVFERFAEPQHAKAPMVRLFAAHYADAVCMCIAGYSSDKESNDGEADI